MEKSNYETYEYLPGNGPENDQFFIVQDNGTYMINRQIVQYATQVPNDKESMETVQVYNVTPQQFLVDVDNSSELISVSDQIFIPDGENNLYANSYLLQPGTSTPAEPMDQDPSQNVAAEFKPADTHIKLELATQSSKQATSCTEITLTDDQYQMLEQKGWILLEIGDKIYVLDTLGLHDITTNHKLIQKLKNEGQTSDNQEINSVKLENDAFESIETQKIALPEIPQCIIENNIVIEQTSTSATPSVTICNKEDDPVHNEVNSDAPNIITSSEVNTDVKDCEPQEEEEDNDTNTRVLVIENEDIRRVGNTLKVKTKLSLKDFPDKIVLGKMVSGKNLIAKIVKPVNSKDNETINTDQSKPGENSQSLTNNMPTIYLHNSNILNETEFYLLMQHFFRNNITKCTADDVVTADSIISQLLQIPSFKTSVIDNNLVITKTIQTEDSSGNAMNKGLSALVTGRVSLIAEQWRFIHLPHMLQEMVTNTEEFLAKYKKDATIKKEGFDVLHVQISEAKQAVTDVVRVSVTVNKRNIPMHLITNKLKVQPKMQPSTMYACSFCAALFDTEPELKDHQTYNCVKHEEMLTIDMDQLIKPRDYCIITSGKSKSYACMQCNAKFNRLTACKNHLKTHYGPKSQDDKEKSQGKSNSYGIYKCNMCPSTYFHPSTLSKHVLARHIKMKN